MEGLLFLAECIAIGLLVFWIVRNEQAGPAEPTTGLFAMRSDPSEREAKTSRRPWVPAVQHKQERTRRG